MVIDLDAILLVRLIWTLSMLVGLVRAFLIWRDARKTRIILEQVRKTPLSSVKMHVRAEERSHLFLLVHFSFQLAAGLFALAGNSLGALICLVAGGFLIISLVNFLAEGRRRLIEQIKVEKVEDEV